MRSTGSPTFEAGILAEPRLAFGHRFEHVDPKTGLTLYGPYSLVGQHRPPLTTIIVGIVGVPAMVADAEQWLEACQHRLLNSGTQPLLYPHFPGFNSAPPFSCQLASGDTWREVIKTDALNSALSARDFSDRLRRVATVYVKGLEVLAQRDPRPHVVLLCIPLDVIRLCTVRPPGWKPPRKHTRDPKRQLALFEDMTPSLGAEEEEEGAHHNLRRAIKAEAMQFGIPTQLVWPHTLDVTQQIPGSAGRVQDPATRAWNFCTALYHKAGGSPWRLADIESGTCFVGVSFYRELGVTDARIRTSMAQAFTSAGDGYVLRGQAFEWDEQTRGKSPHLDRASAAALLAAVVERYREQSRGSLPTRVVIHKTSRYWPEELEGFREAVTTVPRRDFVAFGQRRIQFYRDGDYPAVRGTYIRASESDFLLYTVGYIPYLRTYPGARVPLPLEILEHHGDSPWRVVLSDTMALTKMNWNTADFACSQPITLAFSQRVGQILAELAPASPLRPEYRFYM